MATHKGKASTKAKNKYNARNYDNLHIVVPKGRKPEIQAVAEAAGDSLNKYVTNAINESMRKDEYSATKMYTIIGGVNGTGKSSFTGVLKTQKTDLGVIIDVDKLTAITNVTPIEGGKNALRRIKECLDKGVNFTQETTLAGYGVIATALKARAQGYHIRLYYIGLDTPEECLKRIANRVARGGHSIEENDVRRRFSRRWDAVKKILPHCDEALFFDNDNGFVEVAEYRDMEFSLKNENSLKWVLELSEQLKDR
jgi:predicted ABC-type ATPase